jgi:LysM repeat protein
MYSFWMDGLCLPITPSKLELKINGTNKTFTLINEGEINLLKTPGLTDISFTAVIPWVRNPAYRAIRTGYPATYYLAKFEALQTRLQPFYFVVNRALGSSGLNSQNLNAPLSMLVSMESYTITEDAKDGHELSVAIKLKQYRPFGTKIVTLSSDKTTGTTKATVSDIRATTGREVAPLYIVQHGDTLSSIASKLLGSSARWTEIYDLNRNKIEAAAVANGKESSLNGAWIFSGTILNIPT